MGGLEILDNGERMIPAFHHEAVVYAEHIVRYLFAARFVVGKQVLDVASGVGYGADLLRSAGAGEVMALDRSPEAVRYGKEHHSKSTPAYVVGDVGSLPFHSDQFEVIVSFETIEHVPDYQRFLAEVKRVLRADGLFIVSTPNRGVYVEGNPFHTKEFTLAEFEEALAHHFRYVRTFSQDDWIASAVLSPEEMEGADRPIAGELSLYKAVGKSPLETLYMVSLCSEAPIPEASQEVVLTSLYEMRQYLEELARRDAEIERSRTDLSEQAARLAERDVLLEKKEQALAERDAALRELQAAYEGLRQNLEVLQRSFGYRLLQGYRRGIHRLFPPGSLRATAYGVCVQGLKAIVDRFERLPRGQGPHR
jgi:2-polyprenyl-3-methyl-5-hydroxy-6-metoxy-1,4-benzoquinol methylase